MLAKAFSQFSKQALINPSNSQAMLSLMRRGAYTAATQPNVFVNKHTRVICQGMTGKHVSISTPPILKTHFLRLRLNSCIGNLPHPAGYSIRHQDGWWSQQQEGRH